MGADDVAGALERAAGKVGARVSATVDTSGRMFNVFAKLLTGDETLVASALVASAAQHGWVLLSKNDRRGITWWFEPNSKIKGAVSPSKLPRVLYHVTTVDRIDNVLTSGLTPRSREFVGTTRTYAPRVYLATDVGAAKATFNRPGDWALLTIDRGKLTKGTKFYVDQEFGHRSDGTPLAVYTLQPIPALAISVVA